MSTGFRAREPGVLVLLAVLSILLLGCVPTAPPAVVRSTLGPGAESGSDSVDGPLEVRHVAPVGPADQSAQLTVVFNKPVRDLAHPDAPVPSIRIEPEVPGRWQWVGSRALRFQPQGGLPPASTISVTIPAGLEAQDGTTLLDPKSWSFTTAGPQLLSSHPSGGERRIAETETIELTFDPWIEPARLTKQLSLRAQTAEGTREVLFELEPELRDRPRTFTLHPRPGLPSNAEVTLEIGRPQNEARGPDIQHRVVRFHTVGPLRVLGLRCEPELQPGSETVEVGPDTRCDPDEGLSIVLSNYVDGDRLLNHLRSGGQTLSLSDYGGATEQGYEYRVEGLLGPGRSVRVEIVGRVAGSTLRDEHERPLEADFAATVQAGDRMPFARIALRGTYGARDSGFVVPYLATNTEGLRLSATRLTPAAVMARLAERPASEWGVELRPDHPVADPPRNQSVRGGVPLATLLGDADPVSGAMLLSIDHSAAVPEPDPSSPRGRDTGPIEVQFSDLAILTRVSHSVVHVWVLDRKSGAPIANAAVTLRRTDRTGVVHQARTDSQGRANLALSAVPEKAISAIFVHHDDDWAYQPIGRPEAARWVGTMFTDRGLYRPGETVRIKGILRQPREESLITPAGQTVEGRFVGPDGQDVHPFTATLNEFGSFSIAYAIPPEAPLGRYAVRLDEHSGIGARLQIAEYHPTAFEAETAMSHDERIRGDDVSCTATGRYLYGSPMVGADARLSLRRSTAYFTPPGHPGYSFRADDGPHPSAVGSPVRDSLDARGQLHVERTLTLPDMHVTERVSCEVAIADLDHRVQTSESSTLVHPGELYIGLRDPDGELFPGDPLPIDVLVVTPSGRTSTADVTVELWAERVDVTGARLDDVLVDTCEVRPDGTARACTFTTPALDGADHLGLRVRALGHDPRGNPIRSSLYRSVSPPPPPAPPAPPSPPEPTTFRSPPSRYLDISLNRESVEVGDVLIADVRSPFTQTAKLLVSVERESVLHEQIVTLPPAGTQVRIPVTATMVPNAEVHVHAILGEESDSTGAEFEVAPDAHRLNVKLEPSKTTAKPGETLDLDLRVTDARGKPVHAEITLWAADEGTLSLAQYATPDPVWDLFQPRWSSVQAGDTRASPLEPVFFGRHRTRAPRVRMGATSVSDRNPREDFRQTVLFESSLRTDAQGRLRHRVKLPDGLTEYRFMAVALTRGDRVGHTEASVKTNQALMVRPNVPNVIRAGDRFSANVIVSTKDLPARNAIVDVEARGIESRGTSRKTIRLQPGVPNALQFDFSADVVGPYRITVTARTDGGEKAARDAITLSGEVVAPIFEESALVFGDTTGPVAEALGDLSRLRPDVGGLSIQLSRSRLTGLDRGFDELLQYPYGCTEQTASRMLPLVVLGDLARAVGASLPDDPDAVLKESIARLAAHQRRDGGFGLWSGSRRSEPWLTAYTLGVLAEASERGASVDPLLLSRGAEYMSARLAEIASHDSPTIADLEAAAAMLDALSVMKLPPGDAIRTVFEHRAELSASGRARLLHALARTNRGSDMVAPLQRAVEASIRIDGSAARVVGPREELRHESSGSSLQRFLVLDSDVQSSALALRALAALDSKHPQVSPLAAGLLADRTGRGWGNTHSTAWALVALDAYRRAVPERADFDARVFFGPELLRDHEFDSGGPMQTTLEVPMSRLTSEGRPHDGRLTFDVEGAGRLYYEARLDFARAKLPTEPIDRGFSVIKTLTPASTMDSAHPPDEIAAGTLVRVDIDVVTSSPRQAVVIEDPLPGGLVAVNPELGEDAPEDWQSRLWDRRELRDDRVLHFVDHLPSGVFRFTYYARAAHPGRYVAPPTQVSEMYAPETRGATAASHLVVAREPSTASATP